MGGCGGSYCPHIFFDTLFLFDTLTCKNICYAGDAISGLQHFLPMLKCQLPTAWRLFGAWRKSEIPAQAPPFPDLVLAGLVGLSLHLGLDGLAAALAVAFHCYLRTGEVLGMRCSQLALSHGRGAVLLPQTKKSIRDNVSITDRHVAAVCQRRLAAGAPGYLLVACLAASPCASQTPPSLLWVGRPWIQVVLLPAGRRHF